MTDAERAFTQWNDLNYIKDTDWGYTAFLAGYEAAIAASPSEGKVRALIEAAEKALPEFESAASCVHHEFDGIADMTEMDAAIDTLTAALAALRTTKEGE